ncbi:PH domain-containing protein [Arthrobacter sp. PAMC25564]|uniref:PH domain-containing protein n=1 Tax=Arthrobacter sp. PAMC25564 TaxID=2565366 RepID=UPI0010A29BF5|nr:PH domain-containing protein [Arthrobacter sp. PAMC25564]QCB96835.1 PH domain-containing protein [Arthrobacter sp. PAMC25564]
MSPAPHAGNVEVFKARTNKWFAWLSWAVAAFGVVVMAVTAGPGALAGIAPLVLLGFLGWQLFWMPAVVVHGGGVTLENPFRSIEVPWAALVQVDTRYALTLVTAARSYTSWAAPAPGIWGGRNARPEDLQGLPATTYGPGKSVRPGDLTSTDSGQAARLVRARWHELVESGELAAGEAATTAVKVTFRRAAAGAVVLLLAASYWTVTAG